MKITDYTAAYCSIIWFAIDDSGRILVADSDEGEIPSFAKEDEARTQQISNIFLNSSAIRQKPQPAINFEELAAKGFYCFRCDNYDGTTYHLCARPTHKLNFSELNGETQKLLQTQKVDFDIDNVNSFQIIEQRGKK